VSYGIRTFVLVAMAAVAERYETFGVGAVAVAVRPKRIGVMCRPRSLPAKGRFRRPTGMR